MTEKLEKTEKTKSDKAKKRGIEDVLLDLCIEAGVGKTVSPTQVAKSFAEGRHGEGEDWHHWISHVRRAAIGLARIEKVTIYRKGKPADPEDFRGLYRLGLPVPGQIVPKSERKAEDATDDEGGTED